MRDAQNGCAKIENDNGQVRLITENQKAVPQFSDLVLIGGEEQESDVAPPTDAVPIEENVNIPAKEVQISEQVPSVGNKEKEKNRQNYHQCSAIYGIATSDCGNIASGSGN